MTKVNALRLVKLGATALGMLLVGFVLAGCHSAGSDPRFSELPALTGTPATNASVAPAAGDDTEHSRLQKGDAVTVNITDLPTPQPEIQDRIREDGTITLLQNQTFVAAGKTRTELEKEIHARYVPNIFKTMTVTIRLTENTRFYYVDGEVKRPDRCVYLSRLTVSKAISSANGFTEYAQKKKVKLIRADGRTYTVNCVKALKDPSLDLEVFPGDKVYVPRRWF